MKMFEAEDLVRQGIKRHGNHIGVACSFGKDSMVVLHMALKVKPDIKVFFNNTGIEFPETIKFKEKLKKEWNLNLIEMRPYKGMTFWKCVEKYGLPEFRGGKSKNRTPKCCYYLKEKPAITAYGKEGIVAIFTGIMASESRNRHLLIQRYDKSVDLKDDVKFCGQRYFARTWNIWKYHPIAYWSEEDVWNYIEEHDIPVNPVYTKWNGIYNRLGCLPCTGHRNWERKLSKSHPKLYLKLKRMQDPNQATLES